jgi:predicted enzyme related to lactoylglutathione lyase
MGPSLRHVGIVVQDIDCAIKFWKENFDFVVRANLVEEGPFIDNLLGLSGTRVQTVKMKCSKDSEIELLKFDSGSTEQNWGGRVNKVGLTHIAINIEDLETTLKKLLDWGFSPVYKPQISIDGEVRVCYIEVIEGLLLELVEKIHE